MVKEFRNWAWRVFMYLTTFVLSKCAGERPAKREVVTDAYTHTGNGSTSTSLASRLEALPTHGRAIAASSSPLAVQQQLALSAAIGIQLLGVLTGNLLQVSTGRHRHRAFVDEEYSYREGVVSAYS